MVRYMASKLQLPFRHLAPLPAASSAARDYAGRPGREVSENLIPAVDRVRVEPFDIPLTFSVSLNCSTGPHRGYNAHMSDDFVNHIAGYLKSRRQEVDIRTKKALQDEGIKKSRASEGWSSLRDWMKKFCEDANREEGQDTFQLRVTHSQILEVAADVPGNGNRILHTEFSSETGKITYHIERGSTFGQAVSSVASSTERSGTFMPVLDGTEFYFSDGSDRISVAKMGQVLIKSLLNMPQ
jgi:hypothetical protein